MSDTPPRSLRAALTTPEGTRRYVGRLFSTIADRYDLITRLLSYGRDRRWKQRLVSMAGVRPHDRVLDLASGTGDIAFEVERRGARVVALDITPRMVRVARSKPHTRSRPSFLLGDMLSLPFTDEGFDVVTVGYGLRNVPHIDRALAEMYRVLRPGGRFLSLDFDRPPNPVVRRAYLGYLTLVGSVLGWVLHRDPDTYRYIPESIRRYPGARGVERLTIAAGFERAGRLTLLGGLMAINVGSRPVDRGRP